jgi:DNA-binding transcriptional regulator YdaS (Cro superfamily)
MSLLDYIAVNYGGSQSTFAKAQGVQPPQVTQWIKKKFIVIDGVLYSPRRILET